MKNERVLMGPDGKPATPEMIAENKRRLLARQVAEEFAAAQQPAGTGGGQRVPPAARYTEKERQAMDEGLSLPPKRKG
jgi:hypothetical protein